MTLLHALVFLCLDGVGCFLDDSVRGKCFVIVKEHDVIKAETFK